MKKKIWTSLYFRTSTRTDLTSDVRYSIRNSDFFSFEFDLDLETRKFASLFTNLRTTYKREKQKLSKSTLHFIE